MGAGLPHRAPTSIRDSIDPSKSGLPAAFAVPFPVGLTTASRNRPSTSDDVQVIWWLTTWPSPTANRVIGISPVVVDQILLQRPHQFVRACPMEDNHLVILFFELIRILAGPRRRVVGNACLVLIGILHKGRNTILQGCSDLAEPPRLLTPRDFHWLCPSTGLIRSRRQSRSGGCKSICWFGTYETADE